MLSILPKGWLADSAPSALPYLLVPSTRVSFLARRYRFIIELDLSPSTRIVVRLDTSENKHDPSSSVWMFVKWYFKVFIVWTVKGIPC